MVLIHADIMDPEFEVRGDILSLPPEGKYGISSGVYTLGCGWVRTMTPEELEVGDDILHNE